VKFFNLNKRELGILVGGLSLGAGLAVNNGFILSSTVGAVGIGASVLGAFILGLVFGGLLESQDQQ